MSQVEVDPQVAVTTDVDGDGDLDVVVGLGKGTLGKQVVWFQNLGGGNFANSAVVASASGPVVRLISVDVDGDGDSDLLGATTDNCAGDIFWIENLGGGAFGAEQVLESGPSFCSPSIATGDVDDDGDQDLLWAEGGDTKVKLNRNLGGGSFASSEVAYNSFHPIKGLALADYSGDGILDLGLIDTEEAITVYGLGAGIFWPTHHVLGRSELGATSPIPFDLDGDGDPDILFGSTPRAKVLYGENMSIPDCNGNGVHDGFEVLTGASTDCNQNGVPDECDILKPLADIDGDGLLDVCFPPALLADKYSLSLSAGGTQTFSLRAPYPGSIYLLLGSVSGKSPGIQVSGLTLPLNLDSYLTFTLTTANTPPLASSLGTLSAGPGGGEASAQFTLSPFSIPILAGVHLDHAFLVLDPATFFVTFTSNAVPLDLKP